MVEKLLKEIIITKQREQHSIYFKLKQIQSKFPKNIMNFIVLLEAQYVMRYVTMIILEIMYKLPYKLHGVQDSKTYAIR